MPVTRLLSASDPAPVDHRAGASGWLLTVEHAGRAVPRALGDLGLPEGEIDRHIGWDIGALALAHAMADRMAAALVAQRYSRLVIDCNRPRAAPDLVPPVSDRTEVPANAGLSEAALAARWDEVHKPFHDRVTELCDGGVRGLVAVHSYDPRRDSDADMRPWPIGLLWRQDNALAAGLAKGLAEAAAALPLGLNAPYEIEDESDYTIPVHAEPRGLPHVLIEVRNDFLRRAEDVERMATLLAGACLELELEPA